MIIIALIRNFLNLSRIDIFWQDFATGAIIIAAVLLDALQKRVGARLRPPPQGGKRMDPCAKRSLGKSGVELPRRLRRRAPGRAVRQGERRRRRGDAAGGLGRGHPLLRHRTLVRSRPERAPLRPLSLPPAAQRVRAVDQGRPRAQGTGRPRRAFDTGFWSGGLHFDHVFDYSYDGIMRAFEDCLQRLGMNRIDLLVIHDLDFWHHAVESKVAAYLAQLATGGWRALEELRSSRPHPRRSAPASTSSA